MSYYINWIKLNVQKQACDADKILFKIYAKL